MQMDKIYVKQNDSIWTQGKRDIGELVDPEVSYAEIKDTVNYN